MEGGLLRPIATLLLLGRRSTLLLLARRCARPHRDLTRPGIVDRWPRRLPLRLPLPLAPPSPVAAAAAGSCVGRAAGAAGAAARAPGATAGGGRGAARGIAHGRTLGGRGEEGGGWSRGRRIDGELLEEKVVADVAEAGERVGAAEVDAHVRVPLVQAPKDIEDESAVMDHFTEVPELIRHGLHLGAVFADGEVALGEDAELGIELEGAEFAVAEKLRLDAKPGRARRAAAGTHGLYELGGDGAEEPREDDGVHAAPCRDGGVRSIAEDVGGEGIALEDEGHQRPDVLDTGGLCMKIGDDGGFIRCGVVEVVVGAAVVVDGWVGQLVGVGRLALEVGSGAALEFKSLEGGADAFLGGGRGKGQALLLLVCRALLGVGGVLHALHLGSGRVDGGRGLRRHEHEAGGGTHS